MLVAQTWSSSGSGGPLSRFPTPLKRTLIESMVEIMTQNHQIMTAVDIPIIRTTLAGIQPRIQRREGCILDGRGVFWKGGHREGDASASS